MVEVILTSRTVGPSPRIEIHAVDPVTEGYGVTKKVYGQILCAGSELIYAEDLKLRTIHVLLLTPETPAPGNDYYAKDVVWNKGVYNNYASIDIYHPAGTLITAGNGPSNGSVWLHFLAVGE